MKRLTLWPLAFLTALFLSLTASAADYAVNGVTLRGNAVSVDVTAKADCVLWGAAYDANGQMTASQSANVSGAENVREFFLSFENGIPENGYAKTFLMDKETFRPLCVPADSFPAYTDNVYAILYADGTLVFQHGDVTIFGREVKGVYAADMETEGIPSVPWGDEQVRDSIEYVTFADKIQPKSTAFWFYECLNLKEIRNLNYLDTSNVKNMCSMFNYCKALKALDLSAFNTANVTDMSFMFYHCEALTELNVSAFNTANVTKMSAMFYECAALTELDVTNFNTANVTDMSWMFCACFSLAALDLSAFDTTNVTNMSYMFYRSGALASLDVSGFHTANVTDMHAMFCLCGALISLDASRFDTTNVEDMESMFDACYRLTTIYASERFVTDQVTESESMFTNCSSLVGGAGTVYNAEHVDKECARIDGGAWNPGYFTAKS